MEPTVTASPPAASTGAVSTLITRPTCVTNDAAGNHDVSLSTGTDYSNQAWRGIAASGACWDGLNDADGFVIGDAVRFTSVQIDLSTCTG